MNRGYTVEQYLEFIDRAVARIPDISIAGDIIVGFPTETEEDFEETIALLRRVPFKNNFIFKYSERPGTIGKDRFEDDVPLEVKKRRNNLLLAVQSEVSTKVHEKWVGREVEVLVEQVSKRQQKSHERNMNGPKNGVSLTTEGRALTQADDVVKAGHIKQLSGRTAGDLIVFFDSPESLLNAEELIGTLQKVHIQSSNALNLTGCLSLAMD